MPNMREIARLAGVSVGTVSLALRNSERISAATRARIQALAGDYGYIPNRLSQAILSGKSRILGCLIHRQFGPHFARILGGVLEQAYRNDYSVMVVETEESTKTVSLAIRHLLEHRVAGIILAMPGILKPTYTEALLATRSAGVHLVAVVEIPSIMPGDRVVSDLETSARLMVEHLWQLGHREVGFLGHQHPVTTEFRLPVYRRCLKRYGMSTARMALVESQQEGINRVAEWLRERPQLTAILTDDDSFATSLLQSAGMLGIRIPQDISVMGTGNFHHTFIFPLVSTIEKHPQTLGQQAVDVLIGRLDEGLPASECTPVIREVEPTLLNRDTTVPLSRRHNGKEAGAALAQKKG
ncbi:MAG: LacI family DNA-binding transcriptional regulator [Armatimonadota bacterium]